MRRSIVFVLSLFAAFSLFAENANRVSVPATDKAPVIDGKVDPIEWKIATRVVLGNNEGQALLMHDDAFLYVGLIGSKPGIGSLCVRGRTGVRILHASAALGTAAFEVDKGKWNLTRTFTWTNRDTGTSEAALADRKKMLSTEGWFANTTPTAAPEREFQVPIRGQKEVPLILGFVTYTPDEQKLYYWPATNEDDCSDVELASGFTGRDFAFDPTKWGVAVLDQ
jgi:hypothetical protein